MAQYFDDLARLLPPASAKAAANWVMGPVKSYLNEQALEMKDFPLDPGQLAGIIELIEAGKLNYSVASKQLFPYLLEHPRPTPPARPMPWACSPRPIPASCKPSWTRCWPPTPPK